jgi:ribokinase
MAQRPAVTVLGSLNTDISLLVPHLPGPGETVLAAAAATFGAGGKGANQAVAAARLGAAVSMVGCCGDDEFGARLRAGLAAEGIGVTGLRAVPGVASGLALITVDPAGENSIAVAAGANGLAGDAEVAAAFAEPCDALVLSAEIPVAVLAAALRRARADGVRTVLNLAPVPEGAAGLLAECPGWLVVNAQEAAALAGRGWKGGGGAGARGVEGRWRSRRPGRGARKAGRCATAGPGGAGQGRRGRPGRGARWRACRGHAGRGRGGAGRALGDGRRARVPGDRGGHRGSGGRVRGGPCRGTGQRPGPGRRSHRRVRGRGGGGHPQGGTGGPAPARRRARGDRVRLARLSVGNAGGRDHGGAG